MGEKGSALETAIHGNLDNKKGKKINPEKKTQEVVTKREKVTGHQPMSKERGGESNHVPTPAPGLSDKRAFRFRECCVAQKGKEREKKVERGEGRSPQKGGLVGHRADLWERGGRTLGRNNTAKKTKQREEHPERGVKKTRS